MAQSKLEKIIKKEDRLRRQMAELEERKKECFKVQTPAEKFDSLILSINMNFDQLERDDKWMQDNGTVSELVVWKQKKNAYIDRVVEQIQRLLEAINSLPVKGAKL